MLRKTIFAIVIAAVVNGPAHGGGLFGDVIEGLCGNCGAGRELDRAHERLGKPLDVPGRVIREGTVETLGPLLAEAIRHSRDDARRAGTNPIPPAIRNALGRYYSPSLLDRIRYRVGQGHELSVQANSFRFGDRDAVALIDTIVFASANDAQYNDVLWAHEVKHIDQYNRWGLTDFAKRYVRDWKAVEGEAERAENEYARLGRAAVRPPAGTPQFPSSGGRFPVSASICATPYGACGLGMALPVGSACYCPSFYGPVGGVAR